MENLFTGYILTGGKSSRMGADKAFLEINGETFIKHAVKSLSKVCENRVKIVVNQSQIQLIQKLPAEIPHIFDVFQDRGVLSGIHAALKNCETKFAIILAVDLPLVTSEVVERLAEITLSNNKFLAVVPRQVDGRLQALCGIYLAKYCVRPLEKLMSENDSASVNDFLELIAPRGVTPEKLNITTTEDLFFNVNSPSDFEQIK